jgi:hypothetical protein
LLIPASVGGPWPAFPRGMRSLIPAASLSGAVMPFSAMSAGRETP